MDTLEKARVSVAEAAYVTGVPAVEINREIDAKVITANGSERSLRGPDILYLAAIKDWRKEVGPAGRRTLRKAIAAAVTADQPTARFYSLTVPIEELRDAVLDGFTQLEQLIGDHIEERDDVLAGEPVIRGTRIAARHIADLRRRGSPLEELIDDFDLSEEQIHAAWAFAQTRPQRGRPASRRTRTAHVPAS